MADKTGYNQYIGTKYNRDEILKISKTCFGRKHFRQMGLYDMAKRENILDECFRIVDRNKRDRETLQKIEKRELIDEIVVKIKSKSDFKIKYPKLYYYAKYHYQEAFESIISQKYSTQQLICKTILESVIKKNCSYNNRSVLDGKELDIFFPEEKLACEYNSHYWHNTRKTDDKIKTDMCQTLGINLIVIREPFLNAFTTIENSIINIKRQFIQQLDKINYSVGGGVSEEDIENLCIDEKDFLFNSYNQKELNDIIQNCDRYSEVKTNHNKIWQYLLRNKMLYVLDPIKKRDYIYMSKSEMIDHIKNKFNSYTDFSNHKIYQLARKRGYLKDIKKAYL